MLYKVRYLNKLWLSNVMARNNMSQDEAVGWVLFGVVVIGIVLAILVTIIMLFRFVFWVSIILFFASLVFFIISIFIDISRCKEEDYFDGPPWVLIAIFCIALFWCSAHFSFVVGYGETAQGILKFNEEYKNFVGVIEEPQNQMNLATRQALNESCKAMPNTPSCQIANTGLDVYESSQNVNDMVDFISRIFFLRKII